DLQSLTVDPAVAKLLPRELCVEHQLVVFHATSNSVAVAMADIEQPEILAFIENYLKKGVMPYLASQRSIQRTIEQVFEVTANDHLKRIQELSDRAKELHSDPEAMAQAVPIIALLDELFG